MTQCSVRASRFASPKRRLGSAWEQLAVDKPGDLVGACLVMLEAAGRRKAD